MNKVNEIIEMEILNGIDRLFHQLQVQFGYGNIYLRPYADLLIEMLPEYVEQQCNLTENNLKFTRDDLLKTLKKIIEDENASK